MSRDGPISCLVNRRETSSLSTDEWQQKRLIEVARARERARVFSHASVLPPRAAEEAQYIRRRGRFFSVYPP